MERSDIVAKCLQNCSDSSKDDKDKYVKKESETYHKYDEKNSLKNTRFFFTQNNYSS